MEKYLVKGKMELKPFMSHIEQRKPNRLISEKSPYLLQHAYNPVDWYPWGEEAFEKAKKEDKPIFLSIGYSTCHWCHVMAEESFKDEEVAEFLNENYVSIKVDREERPDIDNVYMDVCTALTGQGGWPLSIIMTPYKKPIFAGTYFPKRSHYGRPGFFELLIAISNKWQREREMLLETADQITDMLQKEARSRVQGDLGQDVFDKAYTQLESTFDDKYGGFGSAPKFPMPSNLLFLLRYYRATGQERALEMVEKTLTTMRRGGIYDQVGFGFHRYSTDRIWLVPHFEKMLYDNAFLAFSYLETYQVTDKEFYAQTAKEIFTYLLRDMQVSEGGFAAAEDADSEGVEGKYYVWTKEEVIKALGKERGKTFCKYYGINGEVNFEGKNIPNLLGSEAEELKIAGGEGINEEIEKELDEGRQQLFIERKNRVAPLRDDKVLTSWNGLAIAVLARGGRVLTEEPYIEAAAKTADFILKKLRRSDGRLLARYREGEANYLSYLDDYSFLIWGLLELWEATFEVSYLKEAIALMKQQITLFWDSEEGGFFFTGKDAEELIFRSKEAYDGALPSGNSVAAYNLLRLARLTGEEEFNQKANELFKAFADRASKYPSAYTFLLLAKHLDVTPPLEVVVTGARNNPNTRRLWEVVQKQFLPEAVLMYNPGGEQGEDLQKLLPALADKKPQNGEPLAYVCKELACREPVNNPNDLYRLLTN